MMHYVVVPRSAPHKLHSMSFSGKLERHLIRIPFTRRLSCRCIVNGPGEMADANFGYVGGAPGKIDLYVGKEVVRRGIPMATATDELIELIKQHDMWVDKEEVEEEQEKEPQLV